MKINSGYSPNELLKALTDNGAFTAVAIYLCQRLRWNNRLIWPVLAINPLTISVGESGCAVLFRHGVVVMFNLSDDQRKKFISALSSMMSKSLTLTEEESVQVRLDSEANEGADFESLVLRRVTLPRLQIIADVLAKSTIMAFYEGRVAQQFDRIEPIAEQLQLGKRSGPQSRVLLKHIGETLMVESHMVGRAEVVEKPDMLWEFPELDRFYSRLEDEYELHERYEALERKLGLIKRTAETQLSLLQQRSGLRVEWYIVILIVIDIIVSLLVPH